VYKYHRCENISVIVLRRSLRVETRVEAWLLLTILPPPALSRDTRPLMLAKARGRSVSDPDIGERNEEIAESGGGPESEL